MNEIHSERPQAKITGHRVVKPDERRGQKPLLSAHLLLNEIAGRYVSFNKDFNVEKRKEVSFLDLSGLNVDLALHDVIGSVQALLYYPDVSVIIRITLRPYHPGMSSFADFYCRVATLILRELV
ncbi:hypothetical protein ARMGADRAFT_544247 [Armillaria gallica]|uniref:Uncharacterized protein n=1 Tax=Armillaria gallica TaxID=47427 RepID=A0A2H3DC33_ARMGA|nr:hypothetical protein ARMGADRAFT_544247 [Armillaria gallica]